MVESLQTSKKFSFDTTCYYYESVDTVSIFSCANIEKSSSLTSNMFFFYIIQHYYIHVYVYANIHT